MSGVRQRFLGLCLPPLTFVLLDGALTLAGQPPGYWEGTYTQVNEASPTFHQLLAAHPLAFAAGTLTWMSVLAAIILLLPDTLALVVSIAATIGHTACASTWVMWQYQYGYQACNALFVLAAVALGLGIRLGWQARPQQEYSLPFLSVGWRWALVVILGAAAVYLFLWPRSP